MYNSWNWRLQFFVYSSVVQSSTLVLIELATMKMSTIDSMCMGIWLRKDACLINFGWHFPTTNCSCTVPIRVEVL